LKREVIYILLILLGSCKDKESPTYLDLKGGLIGSDVTIYGNNFDQSPSGNHVFFGNVEAEILGASETIISTEVPTLQLGTYEVTVVTGQRIVSAGYFDILFPINPLALWAYYPLDNTAADLGPIGYNGTEFGDLIYSSDQFDKSLRSAEFDGIDDVIKTAATPDFQYRSLSLRIYPTDIMNPNTQVVISMDDNSLDFGTLRVEITGGVLKLWAGGTTTTYETSDISDNQWYHLVLARDPDNVGYYINGTMAAFGPADGNGNTTNPNDNIIIGAGSSTNSEFFKGKIDEVMVFNRVLSENEILFLNQY